MAYLLAHTLIGKRVLDSLPKHTVANEADFYLGCVGPDMFFFDRIPPTPFKPNKKALGNLMHKQSGNALFGAFLNAQQGDGQNTSLIYGFLCHLALDACVHPYIESQHRGLNHTRFEVLIDMQLYRLY